MKNARKMYTDEEVVKNVSHKYKSRNSPTYAEEVDVTLEAPKTIREAPNSHKLW